MKLCKDNFIHPAERRESKITEAWLKKYLVVVCRRMLVLNMGGTEKRLMATRRCVENDRIHHGKETCSFMSLKQEALLLSIQEQEASSM